MRFHIQASPFVMALSVLAVVATLFLGQTKASPPLQLNALSGLDVSENVNVDDLKNGLMATIRLPRVVNPIHYDLEIRPILTEGDPNRFEAPGKVVIRVRCISPTTNITLHAYDMDIIQQNVTVTTVQQSVDIPVRGVASDSTLQTLTIDLSTSLTPGVEYYVVIPFVAKVGDNNVRMSGLYRSFYLDAGGNEVYLATTQFQKLGARMAFPSFDEPNFKSTFNITIGRTTRYHSLCNSPKAETIRNPDLMDWEWDIYEKTVSMPTYLIAIIVSDFVSVVAPSEYSVYDVRTWGPPTMTTNSSGEFSAAAAAKILTFFETYFNSTYQFPKLDSVAIPHFAAGAMENWALNTYRMALMLWYEGESTQFEQWRQAAVIAHEISHHWFGDLVTCDWWNDIWLNEGFARYMQFIGANASLTEHGIIDRYTIDVTQLAMEYDAGSNTEQVRNDVTDAVTNQASRIIYEKAGALIRMMQGFLTEETLIKGLRTYLDKYQYSNTVQDQLFAELQAAANADGTAPNVTVKEIMDSWTLKSGFPIVTLRRAGGNVVFVSQEPFVNLELRSTKQDPGELWYVPITYATKKNADFTPANIKPKFWLDKYTLTTSRIVENSTDEWIILNPDARSFFRVKYDNHFFSLILSQLREDNSVISISSRSQLIDDYFKSAFASYVRIEDALELTKYLYMENENTVWTAVFNNLRQINRYLQDTPVTHGKFKTFLLSKITPVLDRIGWEQETDDKPVTVILRTQLLDWACSFGVPKCEEITRAYVTALAEDGTNIPADIQPMVYCKAVSLADTLTLPPGFDIKEHVLDSYRTATRVERHTVFINSLACNAPIFQQIEGLMDSAIADPSDFTKAHAVQLMQRLAENPENRETVAGYVQMQMIPIIAALNEKAVSDVVTTLASYTVDNTEAAGHIKTLITAGLARLTGVDELRALNAASETLTRNGVWNDAYTSRIDSWLNSAVVP